MKIRFDIDKTINETEVIIRCKCKTSETEKIISFFNELENIKIQGFLNKEICFISPCDAEYFYTENKRVYTDLGNDKYEIRHKIYELEAMLSNFGFVKIEQGVVANTAKIKKVKPLFNGTMEILFFSGRKQYASRRSVAEIKRRLGI